MRLSKISNALPDRMALSCILCLCLIFIYFIGFVDDGYPNTFLLRFGEKLSALQCLELYYIIIIIKRVDTIPSVTWIELTIISVISFAVFVMVFRRPEYALAILTISAVLRFVKFRTANLAMLAISAFSFQYAGAFGPMFLLHKAFAYVDAGAIRTLLNIFDVTVGGAGTLIRYPATHMTLDVNVGCTSTLAMVYAISAAIIYCVYKKAVITRQLVTAILSLLLAITVINWLRIALMLESMDAYEYWHRGTGMQIVSLIEAFTILAIMQIGIQQGRISVS